MKLFNLLFINGINLLFFYQSVDIILSTELDLLAPSKWKLYLVGVVLFGLWILFYSFKIHKLNIYIYIISFALSLGGITYFSNNIIAYQDEKNIEKAKGIIAKVEKGEDVRTMDCSYWLGLSKHRFMFQESNHVITALIFDTTQGNFRTYYFKNKVWVVAD